jgi:propanediol dehydratase small subunit
MNTPRTTPSDAPPDGERIWTALSGRPLAETTLEAAVRGDLAAADLRIQPAVLRYQADIAEQHGNPQLAMNLRRAAELAPLPDDDVLRIYDALRPMRSTSDELEVIAARLDSADAPLCAALVREAAEVYERRGMLRGA